MVLMGKLGFVSVLMYFMISILILWFSILIYFILERIQLSGL